MASLTVYVIGDYKQFSWARFGSQTSEAKKYSHSVYSWTSYSASLRPSVCIDKIKILILPHMFVNIQQCCQTMKVHTYYPLFVVNGPKSDPREPPPAGVFFCVIFFP